MVCTVTRAFLIVLCLALFTSCSHSRRTAGKRAPGNEEKPAQVSTPPVIEKYATLLGVHPSALTNVELYKFVDAWMGTPYSYAGSSRQGIDCSGFVGALYKEVYQKQLPRTARDMEKVSIDLGRTGMKEGDLVFFDINGKKGSHVGVYLHNNRFVHASTSKGVVISDLDMEYYRKTFSHGGRF